MYQVELAPYYLERQCRDILVDKEKIILQEIYNLEVEKTKIKEQKDKIIEDIDNCFYELIGKCQTKDKKNLVNARRKWRQNPDKIEIFKSICQFPYQLVEKMSGLQEKITFIEEEQGRIFDINKSKSFEEIREELKQNKPFTNALLMTVNKEFWNKLQRYLPGNIHEDRELDPYMATTVGRYRERMQWKPSPISSFVNTRIAIWGEEGRGKKFDYCPKVSLNQLFLRILENCILTKIDYAQSFYVKCNPTLKVDENLYKYLRVNTKNPRCLFFEENLITLKRSEKNDRILNQIGTDNLKLYELVASLNSNNIFRDEKEIVAYIYKLSQLGLVYLNLGINHLEMDELEQLIQICSSSQTAESLELVNELKNIKNLIGQIDDNKNELLNKYSTRKEIYDSTVRILDKFGLTAKELNFEEHNILYENNVLPVLNRKTRMPQKQVEQFALAEKAYRVFDNNYISKILYRNIFLKNHSENEKVALIDFYGEVMVVTEKEKGELITNDEDFDTLGRLRMRFLDYLESHIDDEQIEIPEKFLEELYNEFPEFVKIKKSYGIYYQDDSKLFVVNNTAPGFGRHFIRYISDLEDDYQRQFVHIYKSYIEKVESDECILADIGTNLGLNINKHLDVLNHSVAYPESVYKNEISCDKLYVSFNSKLGCVQIEDINGTIVEITPIGFLFSKMSPGFYRFLSTFSNSQGIELSFWDRYHSIKNKIGKRCSHYPRIVVGDNIILGRETWVLKTTNMFNSKVKNKENYLKLFSELNAELGIPDRFFFKMSMDIDGILDRDKDIDEWLSNIQNRKFRKPQLIDLRNYIDYSNFVTMIHDYNDEIIIQELFPCKQPVSEKLIEILEG